MKSLFLSVSIFLGIILSNAQNQQLHTEVYGLPIDTLKVMTQKHPKYFKHLFDKWTKTPSKVSQDELVLLYYGSAFLPEFNPIKEEEAVEQIAKKLAEFDFQNAIKEGEKLRREYPLNTRLYMLLGYAYKKTGMSQKSKFYYKKYGDLLRIPLYSGTGTSFENAFIVRSISDEYLILNQKDLELVMQEVRYKNELPFDVLTIKPKSKDNKRFKTLPKDKRYFNIYLPYFIGQHKTYKKLQKEAMEKYKIKIK
ncbi:MAG TPA: DUF4919 domain-containing protein [Flavobacteriales bacterium]|jgi:hypothetical protein|nr:DUF4919 domain-containing protein [Flavobacteriales bacterium]